MPDQKIELRVFFEGIQLPVQNVSLMTQANNYSTCQISLPPLREMLDIPPRTYVQVFFKDFYENTGKFEDDFRLLWDGEVRGRSFSKSPDGRSFTLTCVDLTNYWAFVPGFLQPGLTQGMDQILIAASAGGTNLEALSWIRSGGDTFDVEQQNILRSDNVDGIGRSVQDFLEQALKLNVFFRIQNQRRKIAPVAGTEPRGRIKVVPDPEGIALFKANELENIFTFALKSVPAAQDLRTVMNRFMEFFFYQSWNIPAPALLLNKSFLTTQSGESFGGQAKVLPGNTLGQTIFKPSTFFTAPPACNVIWPDDYTHLDYRQDFLSEPTRARLSPLPGSAVGEAFLNTIVESFRYDAFAPRILAEIMGATNEPLIGSVRGEAREEGKPLNVDGSTNLNKATDDELSGAATIPLSVPAEFLPFVLSDDELNDDLDKRRSEPSNIPYVLILKDGVPEESREDIKGAILEEIPLQHYAWQAGLDVGGALQANYISRMADYYLMLRQHQRPTSVTMRFNPYLVPGFPAVVLSRPFPVFGEIGSLRHDISADGTATTAITLMYARFDDATRFVAQDEIEFFQDSATILDLEEVLKGSVVKSRLEPDRDLPPWINAAFRPEFVGEGQFKVRKVETDVNGAVKFEDREAFEARKADREGGYQALFGEGVTSMFKDKLPDPAQSNKLIDPEVDLGFSQKAAADLLLRIYDAREGPSRRRFVQSFQQRPIVTMKEMAEFVGATIVNENEFVPKDPESVSSPYKDEVQTIMRNIRTALRPAAFAGGV